MNLYHVTPHYNLTSILERGLLGHQYRLPRWHLLHTDQAYIWFSSSRAIAEGWVRHRTHPGISPEWFRLPAVERRLVLLEVDATGYEVLPDPHQPWTANRVIAADAIPPQRVQQLPIGSLREIGLRLLLS